MTTAPTAVVKLRSPADVLGTLPHLVGFLPQESLVVLCLHGPRQRGGLTMRIDLPPLEVESVVAEQMAIRTAHDGADTAILVCYTEADEGVDLPRRQFVDLVVERLRERGVTASDALLVRAGRWHSYVCNNFRCCPPEGTALPAEPTPAAGLFAAESALRGSAVLPDRAALVASVRPPLGPVRRASLEQTYDRVGVALVEEIGSVGVPAARATTVAMLGSALRRAAQGSGDLSDDDAARIVLGLRDKHARDEAGTLALDPGAEAFVPLLLDLARRTLDCDAAPICTLLAWVAYLNGDGALANVAVERALRCEPDYEMARLIDAGLEGQVPPSAVREVTRNVRRDLRGNGRRSAVRRRGKRR